MSAPARVLYVSPHASLGGAERVTLDLVALHDRSAVEPAVCFLADGPLVGYCRDVLKVPTHLVPAPPLGAFRAARRAVRTLADLIRATETDLVHGVMAWGHAYGGRAAARARRPAVWFQHVGASWHSALEVAAALVPARRILVNSEFTAARQRRVNPRFATVTVVHPGTRLPSEPREVRSRRGRAALGLREEATTVGVVARLQRWKGQDVVLRAGASLVRARAGAHLLVIGGSSFGLEPEYAVELRRLAKTLGIEDRVTFTGFRDDVADCLAALDIAVHASVSPEPFGLALVEAMAAGTALIATDGGAVREIATPGEDAVIVPPGDDERLAVAMLALYDDPDLRRRLAAAGEQTARRRFGADGMTRRVETVYREVLAR